MKKLYTVKVVWQAVVYAENYEQAQQIADQHSASITLDTEPNIYVSDYSRNQVWPKLCKPYGSTRTIEELGD